MLRTEERTVRLSTSGRAEVDGVVRVRSLRIGIANNRYTVEQHEPIAVATRVNGKTERVAFPPARSYTGIAAYAGVAITALVARRILTHGSKSKRRT